MGLPGNISFATITGTFISGVADSPADNDRDPEAVPIVGASVIFTPDISPAIVRDTSANPPVFVLIDRVVCTTDGDGTLIGPDNAPGIRLIAPNNTVLNPTGWTWNVSIRSVTFPQIQFSFNLEPGTTNDLALLTPVQSSKGTVGGTAPGNGAGGTPTPAVTATTNNGILTLSGTGVTENGGVITMTGTNISEANGLITIS